MLEVKPEEHSGGVLTPRKDVDIVPQDVEQVVEEHRYRCVVLQYQCGADQHNKMDFQKPGIQVRHIID